MRYEFRGKDQCGQWHYGSLVMGWMYDENKQPEDTAYIQKDIHHAAVQVLPETVGQLVTGDKYTGDLFAIVCDCDCEFGCSHPTIKCELIWHEQYCQYGYKYGDRFELLDCFGEENIYKIGNRFDNPDLLGEV